LYTNTEQLDSNERFFEKFLKFNFIQMVPCNLRTRGQLEDILEIVIIEVYVTGEPGRRWCVNI